MAQSDEKGGEELQEPYKMIVAEKDPDVFIDLLCANSFMRGNLNGKIPVNENRLAFEAWLDRCRKQHELEARKEQIMQDELRLDDYCEYHDESKAIAWRESRLKELEAL